jgi:hypothetical protein
MILQAVLVRIREIKSGAADPGGSSLRGEHSQTIVWNRQPSIEWAKRRSLATIQTEFQFNPRLISFIVDRLFRRAVANVRANRFQPTAFRAKMSGVA